MVLPWKESDLDEKIFAILVISTACDCIKLVGSFSESNRKAGHMDSLQLNASCSTPKVIIDRQKKRANKEAESKRKLTIPPFFE